MKHSAPSNQRRKPVRTPPVADWRPRIIRQAYDISPAVGDRMRRAVTRHPNRTVGRR